VNAHIYDVNPVVLQHGLLAGVQKMAQIIGRSFTDPDQDWGDFLVYRDQAGEGLVAEFDGERVGDIEQTLSDAGAV
jgi:hypothetical protein